MNAEITEATANTSGSPSSMLNAKRKSRTASLRSACGANLPCLLAHRSLKDIAHAEPASDLPDIGGLAFEREARIAGDHEQPLEPRERGDDFLNHPVHEVFLLRVATHILERQHGDGGLVRERRGALGRVAGIWVRRFSRHPHLSDETESLAR